MVSRLFFPYFRITRNRLLKDGKFNLKLLPIGLLGIAICIALYFISWKTLGYFHAQSELGIILSMKIFQMVWITIFAMLVFSSMITGVSTLYLSKDNEVIVASPVSMSELYGMRLVTTFLNTSWMVVIFSVPVFAAFGVVFQSGPWYWLLLIITVPATASTATGAALLFIIILVYLFPARRTKDIIFYLTLCFGIFLYLIFRLMRPEDMVNPEKYGQFIEYLSAVSNPAGPWLPAGWTANLLTTYLLDQQVDWLLLGLITLTPLVLYYVGEVVMIKLFIPGFSKSQESFGGNRHFSSSTNSGMAWIWIFKKELISFLRDSKEWSQFFMIGALVVVYLYNFKVLPLERTFGTVYVANLIAFGNIGLTGFLSASLAARFVYPAVGAEGGAFYLIKSSPLTLSRYLWYKYLFYVIPFTFLTLVLIGVSNHFLQISGPMWWISLFSATITCWSVVAMALGFGAVFADYNAENRAASMGTGAVFYLFCSITYVLGILFLGFKPTYRLMRSWIAHNGIPLMDAALITSWGIGVIVLSIAIALFICRKGVAALHPQ
jgi:ABC-2 type transport system permease protein